MHFASTRVAGGNTRAWIRKVDFVCISTRVPIVIADVETDRIDYNYKIIVVVSLSEQTNYARCHGAAPPDPNLAQWLVIANPPLAPMPGLFSAQKRNEQMG